MSSVSVCIRGVTSEFVCFCVYVRGVAGEPAQIKCTLNGTGKVRLGQKVDGDIQVHVRDKHGNEIKKVKQNVVTSHVFVSFELVCVVDRNPSRALFLSSVSDAERTYTKSRIMSYFLQLSRSCVGSFCNHFDCVQVGSCFYRMLAMQSAVIARRILFVPHILVLCPEE